MFAVKQCDLLSSNRMSVTNVDTTKHRMLLHHVHIVKQSLSVKTTISSRLPKMFTAWAMQWRSHAQACTGMCLGKIEVAFLIQGS